MSSGTLQRETQIPRVTGAIPRPRLIARLQRALDHKLTLICAPPGYGKTTIAAQFAARLSDAVAWHALEERERDLPNLHGQALRVLEPVVRGIDALATAPGFYPAELATVLADHLRENTLRKIVYILDDIQLITGSPAAETWLQVLVERLPANIHLILIGRVLPNLPLTEMIARGDVLALGQDDLRFTPEEIYDLSHATPGVALTFPEAEQLAFRLEGWPAGTVLALHPLPSDLEELILSGGKGPEALFNALARSMLEAQPPGLRDFLLYSSTLLRVTPELCTNVLGLPDSANWLSEAQRRNLFLSRVAGGLVYHRLFRSFLQQQLHEDNSRLYVSLHTRAARWFEEHDQIDWSLEHYLSASLVERAARISDNVANTYFSQGKVETLLEWRVKLGQVGIFAPNLLYNCARVHTDRYAYDEAEHALDEAYRGFADTGDWAGEARVRLQRAFIKLQRGAFHEAAREASQSIATLPDHPDLRGRALKILGVAHLRLGEVDKSIAYLEQALDLCRVDGDAYALANALQDLSVAYSRVGRLSDASACLQEVVGLRRSLNSPSALASALNNLGFYYHRGGDYERALATFQEGLNILARVPNRRTESALLWSLGELRRDQSAFEESLRLHNRALALIGNSEPWLRCTVLVSFSTLDRWWGRLEEAESLAAKASDLAARHGLALEQVTAGISLWAARAQLGQAAAAADYIQQAIVTLRAQNARHELIWAYTLAAINALLCSDRADTDRYLQQALQEGREAGTLQTMVVEIGHTPLLESYIVEHAGQYGDVIGGLKHLRAAQTNVRHAGRMRQVEPDITYSLRVVTLGREKLDRDGETVALSEWRSNTAREMFFYLLFQGAQTREQIGLDFWPDSSAQRVRSNFHTTLYRARQALGENVIVYQDGVYLLNPDLDLWCDAHELHKLTQQARLLPIRDARTEDLWRRATELYQGDFLSSWDADWVVTYRESCLDAYSEALIGLGQCVGARRDFRAALDCYRRVLDVDPYREDVHRAIVICYAELGEKKQIIDHYQRLQALLRDELGIEPADETTELVSTLLV